MKNNHLKCLRKTFKSPVHNPQKRALKPTLPNALQTEYNLPGETSQTNHTLKAARLYCKLYKYTENINTLLPLFIKRIFPYAAL